MPFLIELHRVLSKNFAPSILSWNNDGTTFVIFDKQKFVEQIFPMIFSDYIPPSYKSFCQQLIGLGFFFSIDEKCSSHHFFHIDFKLNSPDLLVYFPDQNHFIYISPVTDDKKVFLLPPAVSTLNTFIPYDNIKDQIYTPIAFEDSLNELEKVFFNNA